MTTDRFELLESSWARLAPHATAFADAFYARLFELEPRLEDLFALTRMESQGQKFVAMLDQLVRVAREPDRFRDLLAESGRRHAGYGVLPRHYRTVGEAMLWALDRTAAGPLRPEEREVWAECYTRMAALMQRGGPPPGHGGGVSHPGAIMVPSGPDAIRRHPVPRSDPILHPTARP